MKVISFNIRCWDDKNGNSIEERAPRLKSILKKYDGDIIGLQEVTPKWISIIEEYFSNEYYIFNKFRSKIKSIEASTILWKKEKFTEIDKGYFWFSDTPWVESLGNDSLYKCERICEWVNLKDNFSKKELYLFNLHFGFGDDYQVQSVKLIKQSIDALKAENVIITGDFNADRNSCAYKEMNKYFTDVNEITEKYYGPTFHNYGKDNGMHIDYIFITPNTIKPNDYHIIDDLVDGKYPSDHYGILSEIEII